MSSRLPANERQALYEKMTQHFKIVTLIDGDKNKSYKIYGLDNDKIGCDLPPIPFKTEITSIFFFLVFMGFFFIPSVFILVGIYLLYNLYLFKFFIYIIIYLLLIFIPIKENKEILQNPVLFGLFLILDIDMFVIQKHINILEII